MARFRGGNAGSGDSRKRGRCRRSSVSSRLVLLGSLLESWISARTRWRVAGFDGRTAGSSGRRKSGHRGRSSMSSRLVLLGLLQDPGEARGRAREWPGLEVGQQAAAGEVASSGEAFALPAHPAAHAALLQHLLPRAHVRLLHVQQHVQHLRPQTRVSICCY